MDIRLWTLLYIDKADRIYLEVAKFLSVRIYSTKCQGSRLGSRFTKKAARISFVTFALRIAFCENVISVLKCDEKKKQLNAYKLIIKYGNLTLLFQIKCEHKKI